MSSVKGLSSRAFFKISLLADFQHFLKMSLKFILLMSDFKFNLNDVIKVLMNVKIYVIMPHYDFIVKLQNLDLGDL